MNTEEQVETEEVAPTATPEVTPVPSQEANSVQEALDNIETAKRSKKEKLEYTLKRVQDQLKEFGTAVEDVDLDRPMTIREYEARRVLDANDTAISLVDNLNEDNKVKELTKYHLENTIKPSGDAQTDLRLALTIVNAVKNSQLAEESGRAARVRTTSSAPAAPPRQADAEVELTREQEQIRKGFGLTKEEAAKAVQS